MTPCIEHGQKGDKSGYGMTKYRGQFMRLHRAVYCEHNDTDPASIKGKVVMHRCDNPRCVNPEHLLLGTHADNMRDMSLKGRQPKPKLTPELVSKAAELEKEGVPQREISERLGVAQSTISRALRKRTWKHVG